MKIYLNNANDDWICSRFYKEWHEYNTDVSTKNIEEADIIWLIAGWQWKDTPISYLQSKKTIITIHHIVPNKFNSVEFKQRDKVIDIYHVPCEITKSQIQPYTNKPIIVIPFWSNQNLWYPLDKNKCRKELGLPLDKFLVGSFQRDTEGHDLISPKLEKGPDIFCDIVESWHSEEKNTEVVLAGWRRQYIINRLDKSNIKYHYYELPSQDVLNKLYNCLDLYLVAARIEGGPQAIGECALSKTPIISTNVGVTPLILSKESIIEGDKEVTPNVEHAYNSISKYTIPNGFKEFKNRFLC